MLRSRPAAAMAKGTKKGEATGRRCQQGQICAPQRSTPFSVSARASSDAPPPALMAMNAFVARLLFPPAFATGMQRRPTGCECLECSRVGQVDRTQSLRAGNLHGIPCAFPTLRSRRWQWHDSTQIPRHGPRMVCARSIRSRCSSRSRRRWGRRRGTCCGCA